MKYNKKRNIVAAVCAVLIALLAGLAFTGCGSAPVQQQIEQGVQYIVERENADINAVENHVNQVRQQLFFEELDTKLEEDPDYVWTALDQIGTVVFGDSRIVPFATYGFMDESRVLADGGESLRSIEKHLEEVKTIHPNLIVLGYGMNDIGWGYYSPEEYCDAVIAYVDQIQEMLPDAKIYIQSILLPQPQIDEWYDVPGLYENAHEWDPIEQEYFKEHGYNVIDVSDLVVEHADLFGEDGTHFLPDFYPILAERYLKTYLNDTMSFEE